jgi:hypothetical protein
MRELLVRGKNTIDPEVIDPGGRSVEDSPVKSDFTFFPVHIRLNSENVCYSMFQNLRVSRLEIYRDKKN